MIRSFAAIAGIGFVAVAGFAGPVEARLSLNGWQLNGWQLNGWTLNGRMFNGWSMNGRNFNASSIPGLSIGAPEGLQVLAVELPGGPSETPQR